MRYIFFVIPLLISICCGADTTPQQNVSIPSYLGRWYEQARFENWFEKDMDYVFTDYSADSNNQINVLNFGTTPDGEQKQAKGKAIKVQDGELAVSFVWPYWWFRSPYRILYVNPDYTAAVVSGDGDDYLWLLTRDKCATPRILKKLIKEAQLRGFDTTKLRFTKQRQ